MNQDQSALPGWFFPAVGLGCSVTAVWAYDIVACGGVVAGALSTLITLCILVFVRVDVLMVVGLAFAAGTGGGVALARHRWFRERKELLLLLLPVVAFLIGLGVAWSGAMRLECSLGPWTPRKQVSGAEGPAGSRSGTSRLMTHDLSYSAGRVRRDATPPTHWRTDHAIHHHGTSQPRPGGDHAARGL
jgi:hypothetical protein